MGRLARVGTVLAAVAAAGVLIVWLVAPDEGRPEPPAASAADPRSGSTTTPPGVAKEPTATTEPEGARRPFTVEPYRGLGAWIDVFDWSRTYDRSLGDPPAVRPEDMEDLADHGVRTVFFQAARADAASPGALEPSRARALIEAAHDEGMAVVGWYLPTLEDPGRDRARLDAIATLPIDGLAVDIESTRVADEAERNRRLLQVIDHVRDRFPDETLSAIVLPPVVTEVYGTYWPGFPWAELGPQFDVWQPMSYWTQRTQASGWRDPHRYTAMNIALLRGLTGVDAATVHPIGGIGCCEGPTAPTTPADVQAFTRAATEAEAVGASLYDVATTGEELWQELDALNGLG